MSALLHYSLSGLHLIEASAGTGKTYTISGLFIRLLLEKKLSVRQILVVTYTRAATEDLRLRIRQKLSNCLLAFNTGEGRDDFEAGLLAAAAADRQQARRRLTSALQDFDEAAIFTIHAFCQRMLKENALESGAVIDSELTPDLDELLYEIAADFWRKQMQRFPASFIALAARKKILPDRLFALMKKMRPGLLLLPPVDAAVLDRIAAGALVRMEEEVSRALDAVYQAWPRVREEVSRLLLENAGLNQRSYPSEKIENWLAELDGFCQAPPVYQGELPEALERFSVDRLADCTRKKCAPPVHPFFELCREVCRCHGDWMSLADQGLIVLRQEAARYGLSECDRRKQEKNLFAYDDLLNRLQQAMQGPNRQRLIRRIRERFPAALIDEFQDTDPVQYDIFSTLYQGATESLLYIIGDPKQAIYSFRGADIFTYLAAIREVPSAYHLERNYRSTPELIRAVNTLFSAAANPFVYHRIPFHPVLPADEQSPLSIAGQQEPPLQLWQIMRRPEEDAPLTRAAAEQRILASLAAEISRLLAMGRSGTARIGTRLLGARDIAVLVRTNREAQLVQKVLTCSGVPSVQQSMKDLFASREAEELCRVLAAVAEPASGRKIRAALATDMLGGTCRELLTLQLDEEAWSSRLGRFWSWHQCWKIKGFMAMFRLLLDQQQVRTQLLRFGDGERRLTNLLHLGEVLHGEAREKKFSPAGLLAWLADHMAGHGQAVEEHQLRLESDAQRVQIVTIHRAKGLQYDVVFCPFSWTGSRPSAEAVFFHLAGNGFQPALDLGSAEMKRHQEAASMEELAENMRLLYVALTRAVHRCYLVWGNFRGAERSALAWLFHGRDEDAAAVSKRFKQLSDAAISAELAELIRPAAGSIALVPCHAQELPVAGFALAEAALELDCRRSIRVSNTMEVTSFTAITRHGRHGEPMSLPEEAGEAEARNGSILSFPRGAAAGTFLHDVFEHLDFPQLGTEPGVCRQLIAQKLSQHGFAPAWQQGVFEMVRKVLATPLLPDRADLVLKGVAANKRLTELEFYFPLAAVNNLEMKEIFRPYGGFDPTAGLEFTLGKGFLKGYIDLIFEADGRFYLVDWKSNYLGASPADYHWDRLEEVMARERYILQYLLYTVALHLYLSRRIADYRYSRDFGGLFYIFLRGVSPELGPACGIFHDRPAVELIERLSRLLVAP